MTGIIATVIADMVIAIVVAMLVIILVVKMIILERAIAARMDPVTMTAVIKGQKVTITARNQVAATAVLAMVVERATASKD